MVWAPNNQRTPFTVYTIMRKQEHWTVFKASKVSKMHCLFFQALGFSLGFFPLRTNSISFKTPKNRYTLSNAGKQDQIETIRCLILSFCCNSRCSECNRMTYVLHTHFVSSFQLQLENGVYLLWTSVVLTVWVNYLSIALLHFIRWILISAIYSFDRSWVFHLSTTTREIKKTKQKKPPEKSGEQKNRMKLVRQIQLNF